MLIYNNTSNSLKLCPVNAYIITNALPYMTGIPRNHPQSYHSFMYENLFQHVDIDPNNVNILDGNATDLDKECKKYEEKILAAGGIELFMGGENRTIICCFYGYLINPLLCK